MKMRKLLTFIFITLFVPLFLEINQGRAQEADQAQETIQSQEADQSQGTMQSQATDLAPCDGTGRSGSLPGLRRSMSNCERDAAAERNAARRAAAAAGQASPDAATPTQQEGGTK